VFKVDLSSLIFFISPTANNSIDKIEKDEKVTVARLASGSNTPSP
jgi:hypothetical protein